MCITGQSLLLNWILFNVYSEINSLVVLITILSLNGLCSIFDTHYWPLRILIATVVIGTSFSSDSLGRLALVIHLGTNVGLWLATDVAELFATWVRDLLIVRSARYISSNLFCLGKRRGLFLLSLISLFGKSILIVWVTQILSLNLSSIWLWYFHLLWAWSLLLALVSSVLTALLVWSIHNLNLLVNLNRTIVHSDGTIWLSHVFIWKDIRRFVVGIIKRTMDMKFQMVRWPVCGWWRHLCLDINRVHCFF